jgi:putative transposase
MDSERKMAKESEGTASGSAERQSAAGGGALHRTTSGSAERQSAAGGGALHMPWPHAPVHRLSDQGTYFVTAGTYRKLHHFRSPERLEALHNCLLAAARDFEWRLEAWAVFSNHYHFVGHSPKRDGGAESLSRMLGRLHAQTAKWVNGLDHTPGRQVWHNFWETRLTYERSYLARLRYTHQNAVKHGLVSVASQYPWCSAAWFERTATSAQVRTIYGFKVDALTVKDDYDVTPA